jgi:hypothetical protein
LHFLNSHKYHYCFHIWIRTIQHHAASNIRVFSLKIQCSSSSHASSPKPYLRYTL